VSKEAVAASVICCESPHAHSALPIPRALGRAALIVGRASSQVAPISLATRWRRMVCAVRRRRSGGRGRHRSHPLEGGHDRLLSIGFPTSAGPANSRSYTQTLVQRVSYRSDKHRCNRSGRFESCRPDVVRPCLAMPTTSTPLRHESSNCGSTLVA